MIAFLLQLLIAGMAVWLVGAVVYAICMAIVEHRRASYRWKQRMSPGKPIYSREDWVYRPLAWPIIVFFRFLDWIDDMLDCGDDDAGPTAPA